MASALVGILQLCGHRCCRCCAGNVILDAEKFDIVFSDIVMPGESGLDLAHTIAANYPETPVLLASGYSSKQFIPKNERKFPILRKPYKLEVLAEALNCLLVDAP